jgi:formylmethanofuran dehydrogenase subunit E
MRDFQELLQAASLVHGHLCAGQVLGVREELLAIEEVTVKLSEYDLPGPPRKTVLCECCGEGINDNREVVRNGATLCRACAGESYYGSTITLGAYVHATGSRLERSAARSG